MNYFIFLIICLILWTPSALYAVDSNTVTSSSTVSSSTVTGTTTVDRTPSTAASPNIIINNPIGPIPTTGDFVMFSKDKAVNNTSLIGYYAEVKLKNESIHDAELFSLSSEITISSK